MALDSPGGSSLTIGQVADAAGVPASAIRYYEAVGILPKADRVAGKRRYQPDSVDRLLLIRFCRRLGISLTDMRGSLAEPRGATGKGAWRRVVGGRLRQVPSLIREARGVERVLRESRDCDCVTLTSCRFLRDERLNDAADRRADPAAAGQPLGRRFSGS